MKVCVAGLGEVGLPTALHCVKMGLDVIGYDISEDAAHRAIYAGLDATYKWDQVPEVDVYIICVSTKYGTKYKGESPIDCSAVVDVCRKIANRKPKLVSIESTIWMGVTRFVWKYVFDKNVRVAHVPQRYWANDPQFRGVQRRRTMGVPDNGILTYAKWFYETKLEIPIDVATTSEVAELTKVAENAWTYVWIAFAEELAMFCSEQGIDYDEIRNLIASVSDVPPDKRWDWQPQYNLAQARIGIRGNCLPMAMEWLLYQSNMRILKAAKNADKEYRSR